MHACLHVDIMSPECYPKQKKRQKKIFPSHDIFTFFLLILHFRFVNKHFPMRLVWPSSYIIMDMLTIMVDKFPLRFSLKMEKQLLQDDVTLVCPLTSL